MSARASGTSGTALQAVIFDWAGTTVDFGCMAPAEAFVAVFAEAGLHLTHAEVRGPMGRHKREHIRMLLADPAIAQRFAAAHGRAPSDDDVERLFARFVPTQLAVLGQHARLIPGTLEVVAALRARGLRIGSTSGYTADMMAVVAPAAATQGYAPDVIVSASEVRVARPGPAMALRAVALMGVDAARCVKVGDTVADVGEGLSAGMWTVALAVSGNEVGLSEEAWAAAPEPVRREARRVARERLAAAGAHLVVDTIADLPAALSIIERAVEHGHTPARDASLRAAA